jgi:predicted RNA binding protein YcfA (HicA-like mRNA interferase family)
MTRLPRDLTGAELVKALGKLGYRITRRAGGHVRLTTDQPSQHHVTIPAHDPLKLGTLSAILADVAGHLQIDRDELLKRLLG